MFKSTRSNRCCRGIVVSAVAFVTLASCLSTASAQLLRRRRLYYPPPSVQRQPPAAPSAEQVPNSQDGKDAANKLMIDLRGYRYMEFCLVGSTPLNGQIKATCYNTTGLNLQSSSRDSCPKELLDKLNPAELAAQYRVPRVVVNTPRQWLIDWIDAPVGAVREFAGLKAAWCGMMDAPKADATAYTPANAACKAKLGFAQGQTEYLLDDAQGNTWIMTSFTQSVDPSNKYDRLASVGAKVALPKGWSFRTTVLKQELILAPENGVVQVLQDALDNSYELTGKGYSSFKP
jgi:hypothetical protein